MSKLRFVCYDNTYMEILITLGVIVLFVVILLAVANYGGENFVHSFFALQQKAEIGYMTALEFAQCVITKEFDGGIAITTTPRLLGDAYNPSRHIIILSSNIMNNATSVALAIAAHELGHAQQQRDIPKRFYRFLRMRWFSAQFSALIMPLIVIGVIMMFALPNIWIGIGIALGGLFIFLLCIFVRLFTIPIEKDASKRGIELMKQYSEFDTKELRLAKKVLRLALLTYIGDFLRVMLMWTGLVKKTRL